MVRVLTSLARTCRHVLPGNQVLPSFRLLQVGANRFQAQAVVLTRVVAERCVIVARRLAIPVEAVLSSQGSVGKLVEVKLCSGMATSTNRLAGRMIDAQEC